MGFFSNLFCPSTQAEGKYFLSLFDHWFCPGGGAIGFPIVLEYVVPSKTVFSAHLVG
jgi:hypothetical protein